MDLNELNSRIDADLRNSRPDRYEPGAEWLDSVATRIEDKIPVFEARQIAASAMVRRREGEATKRVNKMLKGLAGYGTSRQFALPFDWYLFVDEPVALELSDGSGTLKRVRVALRAMTADDWAAFSLNGRVSAQHRHDAELSMYEAADWLASRQGVDQFSDWAEAMVPRPTKAATA